MRMSSGGFRSEPLPHVAQQSRRDKLRVQPIAADNLLQARDVYDSAMFPSATMLDFSAAHGHGFGNPSSSTPADGGCDWSTVGPIHGSLLPSHVYATRPCFPGYQDVPPQHGEIPTQDAQSYHFSATPYCQNPLPDVVASSSTHQGLEMATGPLNQPWGQGGNELLLLHGGNPRIDNPSVWMNRQPQQWNGEGGEFSAAQGLSLSLASNPPREFHASQFEERYGAHEGFATERTAMAPGLQSSEMRNEAVALESPYAKLAAGNRGCGIAIQSTVSTCADVRRAVGPLGPFTGYATILKSSKFLKPAQQLLVEFCSVVTGSNLGTHCDTGVRRSGTPTSAAATDNDVSSRAVHSGASSSSFNCSTESGGGSGSSNRAYHQVHRPEFQQKKAKLLFMQEEVCRRYKQYHQQMQMVVSAFESVAGLSAATPYTSLALKSVSKHFRCIKNAISDQIRHISKVLGEEFVSSPSSSKSDMLATPRLKLIDQSLRKSGDNNSGFVDHNPPVWRPQRGLPERSVAVLRAWLFEHFLHPYPTDTDKHMLATQTGLTRNQVSNWFINARVRLWKPMVEEIHMLETKGMAEMNLNSADKSDGKMVSKDDQRSEAQSSKPPSDCSSIVYAPNDANYQNLEQWHREKRSRMEDCIVPGSMDGGLMSLYHGGMDMGGLGAVSLTLGLRHNEGGASGAHQQQPQQITRHFGSQMVHDFVG